MAENDVKIHKENGTGDWAEESTDLKHVITDISSFTEKTTPHDDDHLLIADSEDSDNLKRAKVSKVKGGSSTFDVNQATHGLAAGNAIYHTGSAWAKAKADVASTLGFAIVISVADTNNFTAATIGKHTITSHGLSVGHYYFVSSGTAGALVSTEPTSGFSNPILYVEDANTIHVFPFRPSIIGDGFLVQSPWVAVVGTQASATTFTLFAISVAIIYTNCLIKKLKTDSEEPQIKTLENLLVNPSPLLFSKRYYPLLISLLY